MTIIGNTHTAKGTVSARGRRPDSAATLAAAVSRARERDVPNYAPEAFRRAVSAWQSVQIATLGEAEEAISNAVEQAALALVDAEERAERSRQVLADLPRLRTNMLRGSLERYHAPDVLTRADEHYHRAVESAENDDEDSAREQADAARDNFREATLRSLERGPIAGLEAAIREAQATSSPEGIRAANAELAAIRETLADAQRGEATLARLRRRISIGGGMIGSSIDDLLDPGGIFTDPDPLPGHPELAGAPDPVLTIRVTDRTEDSLTVIWRDRSSLDETNILLRQTENGPWESVAEFGALSNWTVHADSNLDPETLYCYRVQSENEIGAVTTPIYNRACGYTRDGKGIGVWRIQLKIRIADVSDAGTGDPIQVRLTSPLATFSPSGNQRWLDYGPRWEGVGFRDDFARDREFTYDLDQNYIHELSDITMLTIRKDGSDAIGVAEITLLVNNDEVFNRVFGETSSTCLWIDDGDGYSPSYTVWLQELRADPRWQAFAAKQHLPPPSIPNSDLVSRLESLIGHAIHGTELGWGEYSSPAWVEATFLDEERLRIDLDLEADAPIVEDPEIDINFDLRFAIGCNQAAGTATLRVTSENMSSSVDFDFLTELFGNILTLGNFSRIEEWLADKIEEGFQPIVEQIVIDTGGLCPTVKVEQNGDITFEL
jgi:hypothetical protein